MHAFDERQWRWTCQQAAEFADFCAVVAAQTWKRQLHRMSILNEELRCLSGERAMDVTAFDASLQAMVRNHKRNDAIARHLADVAPEHLRQAVAIAKQYGYLTDIERNDNCLWKVEKPRASVAIGLHQRC